MSFIIIIIIDVKRLLFFYILHWVTPELHKRSEGARLWTIVTRTVNISSNILCTNT